MVMETSKSKSWWRILLAVSLIANIFLFYKMKNAPTYKTMSYSYSTKTTCTDSLTLEQAKAMIAEVNRDSIMFSNKSIFLCKDIVNLMAAMDDFDGIWVRRGMDSEHNIHDLA